MIVHVTQRHACRHTCYTTMAVDSHTFTEVTGTHQNVTGHRDRGEAMTTTGHPDPSTTGHAANDLLDFRDALGLQ